MLSKHSKAVVSRLISALKACRTSRDLEKGRKIHATVVEEGHLTNVFVATALLNMYAKCGSMDESRTVFDRMKQHDVVSWTALILGYAENGKGEEALELFASMQRKGCQPNTRTFVAVLTAVSSLATCEQGTRVDGKTVKVRGLDKGRQIHAEARRHGADDDMFVVNTLVDMYSKCGSMEEAQKAFDRLARRDVISWTALLQGYAVDGEVETVFRLLSRMDVEPDSRTYVAALMACGNAAGKLGVRGRVQCLQKVMSIHSQAADKMDMFVANSLVDTYGKCGSLVDSRMMFDRMERHDVVSWTALISGYAESDEPELGLEMFFTFLRSSDGHPNARTFVAALSSCASAATKEEAVAVNGETVKSRSLKAGVEIHSGATARGYDTDIFVANTLVDMYSKCGSLRDARNVFSRMACRDLVTWNALIVGYLENGDSETALELFLKMQGRGVVADVLAFTSAVMACGNMAALDEGKILHSQVCRCGVECDGFIPNALVDFYGKCGRMAEAEQVFGSSGLQDLVTWNALLAGYSRQGNTERVFNLFARIIEAGLQPDGITFQSVLAACSHAGLVEQGEKYFHMMEQGRVERVERSLEHYHCMIDMLGRANQLDKAVSLVKRMPLKANTVTWMTLLSACEKWKNVEAGKFAFHSLLEIDRNHPAGYVLMANIYGTHSHQGLKLASLKSPNLSCETE